MTTIHNRPTRVHRLVYSELVGPIPDGLCVCHSCDVRNCGNPTHLFLGTSPENTADKTAKGRAKGNHAPRPGYRGLNNTNGILDADQVRTIRTLLREGGETLDQIGRRFGVTKHAVFDIKRGRSWTWLQD